MTQVRSLIIAPDPLARAGLAVLLSNDPRVTVVGQLPPGPELAMQAAAYQPDVVLWDLGWHPTATLEVLVDFVESGLPVVALVAEEAASGVWSAGVRGVLRRETAADGIAAALLAVTHGLVVVDPMFIAALAGPSATPPLDALVEALTPREQEVLRGLAEGHSNKQIARHLAISEHTVKFHVNAIMGKLGAQSRTEAVVRATRLGLILL
jgi:DNA-binding NarL/FixJ family response regulator